MLVLTRKAKQQIQVGPDITITILQVKGQNVRVGIEAPRDICVLRTEVAAKMPADSSDPTVQAALEKLERETEISSRSDNEQNNGQRASLANGSLRCRALRAEVAPLSSPFEPTGPASLFRRRRRFATR
jgi:carbon storage regulator